MEATMTMTAETNSVCRGKHKFEVEVTDEGRFYTCRKCDYSEELFGCQFYVSPEEPECGDDTVIKVTVVVRGYAARIELCEKHKAVHDENFMRARKTSTHKG
jgi:hypothetical protein